MGSFQKADGGQDTSKAEQALAIAKEQAAAGAAVAKDKVSEGVDKAEDYIVANPLLAGGVAAGGTAALGGTALLASKLRKKALELELSDIVKDTVF